MTFSLTSAGRFNLEAILAEFERAGRFYPPLHHQRMVVWKEHEVFDTSELQWNAFINAEKDNLDDSVWWEWDGPHADCPDFGVSYVGLWYGHVDGQEEFVNLAKSVATVLGREDFTKVDTLFVPYDFRSWDGWLATLHAWAFKFQMPLLCCEQSLWGVDDYDFDSFDELSEQFSQTADIPYPLHPLCWNLTYDVFTSSSAAIRAILRPETVIDTNSGYWSHAISGIYAETAKNLDVEESSVTASSHRLVLDPRGWYVQLAESDDQLWSSFQSGLHRLAVLIENNGAGLAAEELQKYGARPVRLGRTALNRHTLHDGDNLSEKKKQFSKQQPDDEAYRLQVGDELQMLLEDKAEAIRVENIDWLGEIEQKIEAFKKSVHVTEDGKVKRQRNFRNPEDKKPYDAVCNTMRNAIEDLKRQLPGQFEAIQQLDQQISFPDLKFVQNRHFTPWRVERRF